MSSAEILRRTVSLIKSVDNLEQLAICGTYSKAEEETGTSNLKTTRKDRSELLKPGNSIGQLTELTVREICGKAVYSSGLAYFLEGRISQGRFWDNTISGKLNPREKELREDISEVFEPRLTFERSKGKEKIAVYGDCGCSWSKEGILCPHAAALMIAWARNPETFESRAMKSSTEISILIEKAREQVRQSLEHLVTFIQDGGASMNDYLEVLQRLHTKIRLWTEDVSEAYDGILSLSTSASSHAGPADLSKVSLPSKQVMLLDFSSTVNHVSLRIMHVVESKYPWIEAIDLYNKTTLSTFSKVLESFVERLDRRKSPRVTKAKRERKCKGGAKSRTVRRVGKGKATRSWDALIEKFVSSGH